LGFFPLSQTGRRPLSNIVTLCRRTYTTEALQNALKKLRLSGLAPSLDVRLQEATANHLSHAEFLEIVLQDELAVRHERLIHRRTKIAAFREAKTLENFDWHFNPAIKKKPIFDLASGKFIRQARDVLLLGPPGTGKSHLVQAIGYQVIKCGFYVLYRSIFDLVRDFLHDEAFDGEDKTMTKYLKPGLLIVDDMGMKQLPKRSGEYLFEIIMRRYENHSTMMTSNRPLEDWGKLIGDVPSATAILDRFLHHAEIITITGRSYRLKDRAGKDVAPSPSQGKDSLPTHAQTETTATNENPTIPEDADKKRSKKKARLSHLG
jgi:DNA replication protein DnaC